MRLGLGGEGCQRRGQVCLAVEEPLPRSKPQLPGWPPPRQAKAWPGQCLTPDLYPLPCRRSASAAAGREEQPVPDQGPLWAAHAAATEQCLPAALAPATVRAQPRAAADRVSAGQGLPPSTSMAGRHFLHRERPGQRDSARGGVSLVLASRPSGTVETGHPTATCTQAS